MTEYVRTLTTNSTASFNLNNIRAKSRQTYTVCVYGTFGSGTVALKASPDSGNTGIDIKDASGTAVTFTINGMVNVELMSGGSQAPMVLQAVLTGATNPSITISVFDNR
jgi:ribosomal protein S5